MALSVELVKVISLGADRVYLQWDILGAKATGIYQITIFRGQSSQGPWNAVGAASNIYNFVDKFVAAAPDMTPGSKDPSLLSMATQPYYRVDVAAPDGRIYTAISAIEPGLTGRQRQARRKMLRDEAVLLAKGNGTPVAVCKRARWGVRCTSCYDPYTGDLMHGECSACFGTSFVPGYMTPVITYARRTPNATQSVISEGGKTDTNGVQITLLDVPKLQDDDMIVFLRDNARFVVRMTSQTELQTVGVHQEVSASEIAKSSIEYQFPVEPLTTPKLF